MTAARTASLRRGLCVLRRGLESFEISLIVLLLGALLALSFVQVLLRQVHGGWLWAEPLIRHLVLWIAFAGGALAASRSRHIRIDALGRLLRGRPAAVLRMLLEGLTAWICWRLARAGWAFAAMSREFGDQVEGLDWPAWILQAAIPAGFALIGVHALLNLALGLLGEPPPADPAPGSAPEDPRPETGGALRP
jgi:C4-dicarboxylate transporter, DctQ subunit